MARSPLRVPAVLDRRAMLWRCIGILGLCRRSAGPSSIRGARFRALTKPVVVPLTEVTAPWRPFWFDALGPAPETARSFGPEVMVKGVLLRLPGESGTTGLKAFCLTCPHEICHVSYLEDTEHVRVERSAKPEHPLFLCACHFSVFNPRADGARIAGPASRGLYRFRLEVMPDTVEINAVEEEALGWGASKPPNPRGGNS